MIPEILARVVRTISNRSVLCKPSSLTRVPAAQNPQGYAKRIQEHADRAGDIDVHSGANFRALASYLNRPFTLQPGAITGLNGFLDEKPSASPLACVHSVAEDSTKPTLKLYRSVASSSEFTSHPPAIAANAAHLVWLSGLPAPEWINAVGAQYRIDPEFFRRHLAFLRYGKDSYDIAPLPSSTQRMITLRLTTICRRPVVLARAAIETARADSVELVRKHQQRLRPGDSTLRKYEVFNNTIFTIEQEISVYVERSKHHNGWIGS